MGWPGITDDVHAQLRELNDRNDIHDCMQRYARGMDRQDRALLRSAYHDGAIDWAFAYHSMQTRYQHFLLNHSAEIDGDTAHAETYYQFVGTDKQPANHLTISGGRYVDRLERGDGRWAIAARVCVVEWNTELTSQLTDEIIAMVPGMPPATHDRTDPSYDHPLVAESAGQH
jgi:hypothetical protein